MEVIEEKQNCTIDIHISGDDFSPEIFNDSLPDELKGEVRFSKLMSNGEILDKKPYWHFDVLQNEERNPEDVLYDFLNKYKDNFVSLSEKYIDLKKHACIAKTFYSLESIHGFFISKKLINLCNEIDFEIDIDLYGG